MRSTNNTEISGTFTRDCSFKPFDSGARVSNGEVAVSRGRMSDYPPVKGWGSIADALNEHGRKGNTAFIEGVLRTELYPDTHDKQRKLKSTFVLIRKLKIIDDRGNTLVEAEEDPRAQDESEDLAAV